MDAPALTAADLILDRAEYQKQRPAQRSLIMPLRALRRVTLGDRVALAFENRATLQYQAQEMIYAEGISDPRLAAAEAATYARLLPATDELCATLFVELEDEATVRAELTRLRGLQHALHIRVGRSTVSGVELPGPDEDGPNPETHSVHFVRFQFSAEQRDEFRDPAVAATLLSSHAEYPAEAALSGETRLSLIADLNR